MDPLYGLSLPIRPFHAWPPLHRDRTLFPRAPPGREFGGGLRRLWSALVFPLENEKIGLHEWKKSEWINIILSLKYHRVAQQLRRCGCDSMKHQTTSLVLDCTATTKRGGVGRGLTPKPPLAQSVHAYRVGGLLLSRAVGISPSTAWRAVDGITQGVLLDSVRHHLEHLLSTMLVVAMAVVATRLYHSVPSNCLETFRYMQSWAQIAKSQ